MNIIYIAFFMVEFQWNLFSKIFTDILNTYIFLKIFISASNVYYGTHTHSNRYPHGIEIDIKTTTGAFYIKQQ